MILCVVYQTITREYNSFGPAGLPVHGVDVALVVGPSALLGEVLYVVAELVSADASAVDVVVQAAGAPAHLLGFFLGDEVGGRRP